MEIEELQAKLHRTWLHLLTETNDSETAMLVIDSELAIVQDSYGGRRGFTLNLAALAYSHITTDVKVQQRIEGTLRAVAKGRFFDQNGNLVAPEDIAIEYQIKLLEIEPDWQRMVRELIVNAKNSNQGNITEKVFTRHKKAVIPYNEMKFGSQSEVRIAQELEEEKILFFPLPLAVRHLTGQPYLDHREPDFLICHDGVWGILEVSNHAATRYEQDQEKDAWFKDAGILCIEHRTADKCRKHPEEVVKEFLAILAKHKRQ